MNNKEWNGEGLPPIGAECEFYRSPTQWFEEGGPINGWEDGDVVKVLSIQRAEACEVAVLWNDRDKTALSLVAGCLRPIKPEPSESDLLIAKRDKAVDQIVDDMALVWDSRIQKIAEAIHDAGYRKVLELTDEEIEEK